MPSERKKEPHELNIHQRIHAVMCDVRGVGKHEENKHQGYKYAGHEAVTAALREAYTRHRIVRSVTVLEDVRDGGLLRLRVQTTWTNIDDPADAVSVITVGESPSVTKNGAASPVQSGIAFSYAVKNAEFKMFALTGDDTPAAEETDRSTSSKARPAGREQSAQRPREETSTENAGPYLHAYRRAQSGQQLREAAKAVRARWAVFTQEQQRKLTAELGAAKVRLQSQAEAEADDGAKVAINGILKGYAEAETVTHVEQVDSTLAGLEELLTAKQKAALEGAARAARQRVEGEAAE